MAKQPSVTKRSLMHWVRSSDIRLQVLLLCAVVVHVLARLLPLEMQKRIVNQAIGGRNLDLLYVYCAAFAVSVFAASGLKFAINTLQAKLGERALAELRKQLYYHILRLPVPYFRKTPAGVVVSALITELSTVGDFVGQAVAVPINNVLQLLAFGVYLMFLDPLLAAVSFAVYPLALLMVPKLQARANRKNKLRVDRTREMANTITETVRGVPEIHAHGSYEMEQRKFQALTEKLYGVRILWVMYRYGAKVLNNFFVSLGPLVVFVLGGYLTITGRLDLGALVAFLSAQEKLYDPWKELIDFYQLYQDAEVRYFRTMEQFDAETETNLMPSGRDTLQLVPTVDVNGLSYMVDGGTRLLTDVSLQLSPGEKMALVGFSGSGKSTLAMCINQLYRYTTGRVSVGGEEVSGLTKLDLARNMGFVAQSPFIFDGSIRDNLVYAAQAAGNGDGFGQYTRDDLIRALQQTGLYMDVLRFGLRSSLKGDEAPLLRERLVPMRTRFQQEFGRTLEDYVEFFDPDAYLRFVSVADNLLFAAPLAEDFATGTLHASQDFREFLRQAGLMDSIIDLGADLATATVDILGGLPAEAVFFEQSPVPPDEIESVAKLVAKLSRSSLAELSQAERDRLLELGLGFMPGRHKMTALPESLEARLLEGRKLFRQTVGEKRPKDFAFYEPDSYLPALSIQDNILFGRPKTDSEHAQEVIGHSLMQQLIEEEQLETVVEIGMDHQVGVGGDKLSGGQKQKLAIARVLLKDAPLLILDEATSALDNRSQARIQNLLHTSLKDRTTVISVVHRLDTLKDYDTIAVMKAGRIVEIGPYKDLMTKKGALYELVTGRTT